MLGIDVVRDHRLLDEINMLLRPVGYCAYLYWDSPVHAFCMCEDL
jgi:hypothetical protein